MEKSAPLERGECHVELDVLPVSAPGSRTGPSSKLQTGSVSGTVSRTPTLNGANVSTATTLVVAHTPATAAAAVPASETAAAATATACSPPGDGDLRLSLAVVDPGTGAPLERVPTYLQPDIPLRERLHHFTFAWYTVTMSTSGVALVLGITPHRFAGLNVIGLVLFLLDLVVFAAITAALLCRFAMHRHTFRRALTHPSEALFSSTFFLSIAALLSCGVIYARLFHLAAADAAAATAMHRHFASFFGTMFWIYLAATFAFSVGQYHLLFTVKPDRRLTFDSMTPAWILPIFPAMLAGTLASVVAPVQTPARSLPMLCAGLAAQGLGFLVSVFMYATYLSRLMAFGLPAQRPGMFIAVGPPSFTCAAFIGLAADFPRVLAAPGNAVFLASLLADEATATVDRQAALALVPTMAASVRLLAVLASIFLWGLSFWFFFSAAVATAAGMPDRRFHLSWWSFVFPNAGLTIATIRIGDSVGSPAVLWLSSAMTVALVASWLFIAFRCVRAVMHREIVWPGHDEDT